MRDCNLLDDYAEIRFISKYLPKLIYKHMIRIMPSILLMGKNPVPTDISINISYKVGPLPVITGVITPISRVKSPGLPIYVRPFIGLITPFINDLIGAHQEK